jgi:hypothetical protein
MIEVLCVDGIKREFTTWRFDFYCENCSKFLRHGKPENHTCVLTYKTLATGGKDRYGRYFNFTGHEGKGCFWCGKAIKVHRRYCNKDCQRQYFNHFFWLNARNWCLERYHSICQGCGSQRTLDVHHIIPVKESGYSWNILNRPENLIPLCKKCHGEVRNKTLPIKILHEKRQLVLF